MPQMRCKCKCGQDATHVSTHYQMPVQIILNVYQSVQIIFYVVQMTGQGEQNSGEKPGVQFEASESSCTKVNVHASLEFHPASHLHFMSLLLLGLAHKTHIAWQQVLPQVESNELKSYGIFITFVSGPHLFIANFIGNSQIVQINSKCIHDIKTTTTLPFFTTATKFHNICVILFKTFFSATNNS